MQEWLPRIALPESTLHAYLTFNIHYRLDTECLKGVERFYGLACKWGILPPYRLRLL